MFAKRFLAIALLAVTLAGCGQRSARHPTPNADLAAVLTVQNNAINGIDVYLDDEYLGFVAGFETTSFAIIPGSYAVFIDEIGDGSGPFHYTNINADIGSNVGFDYDLTLIGLLFDVVFR